MSATAEDEPALVSKILEEIWGPEQTIPPLDAFNLTFEVSPDLVVRFSVVRPDGTTGTEQAPLDRKLITFATGNTGAFGALVRHIADVTLPAVTSLVGESVMHGRALS